MRSPAGTENWHLNKQKELNKLKLRHLRKCWPSSCQTPVDTGSDDEEVVGDDSGNMHVRASRQKLLSTQQAAEECRERRSIEVATYVVRWSEAFEIASEVPMGILRVFVSKENAAFGATRPSRTRHC